MPPPSAVPPPPSPCILLLCIHTPALRIGTNVCTDFRKRETLLPASEQPPAVPLDGGVRWLLLFATRSHISRETRDCFPKLLSSLLFREMILGNILNGCILGTPGVLLTRTQPIATQLLNPMNFMQQYFVSSIGSVEKFDSSFCYFNNK